VSGRSTKPASRIPPIYMLGSCRRDSLQVQLNKCCVPAPPTTEKRVHVMVKVKADRQIANNHSSPSCSCSSTSISCGDPTPRASPCASKTRTKPHPHVQSHHNLTGQRFVDALFPAPEQGETGWAVWLSCRSLNSTSQTLLASRPSCYESHLRAGKHRIARVTVYFHVIITSMLKIQEYR
jgi:hypothetical protein